LTTTFSPDSSGSKCANVFSLLLLVALWIMFAAAVAVADPGKPLRVVMDNNYPPYIFLDGDGAAQGILVDRWRLWEKRTGIPVQLSVMDWGSALRRMKNGDFDVIDTVFKTEERSTWLEFGSPMRGSRSRCSSRTRSAA
jgi:hypothetical protein